MKSSTGINGQYKFLINTFTDWNEPPRARHQVAHTLATLYPVIFISANRIGFPNLKLFSVSDNLQVIVPHFPVDPRIRIRIPLFNRLYQYWLFRQLKKKYEYYCVINFDFTARYLFSFFQNVIYYCNDDHVGMSYRLNKKWIAKYQDQSERTVARESKFCIGTSAFLVDKLRQYNDKTFEIRLGAPSIDFFPNRVQKQFSGMINAGFVGFIDTIDKKLVDFLLSQEDIHMTLVGPIKPNTQKILSKHKNITITGQLTGIELYKEVSRFDVGIIPYAVNSTIDRTPNKLWLYLALGVPVVISNIISIRNWVFPEKFVYLSNNNIEFYIKIHRAFEENDLTLAEQRAAFARENSWDQRMNELLTLCDLHLYNKRGE